MPGVLCRDAGQAVGVGAELDAGNVNQGLSPPMLLHSCGIEPSRAPQGGRETERPVEA